MFLLVPLLPSENVFFVRYLQMFIQLIRSKAITEICEAHTLLPLKSHRSWSYFRPIAAGDLLPHVWATQSKKRTEINKVSTAIMIEAELKMNNGTW